MHPVINVRAHTSGLGFVRERANLLRGVRGVLYSVRAVLSDDVDVRRRGLGRGELAPRRAFADRREPARETRAGAPVEGRAFELAVARELRERAGELVGDVRVVVDVFEPLEVLLGRAGRKTSRRLADEHQLGRLRAAPRADRTREVRVHGRRLARLGVPEPRALDAHAGDGAGHPLGARFQRHVLELRVGVEPGPVQRGERRQVQDALGERLASLRVIRGGAVDGAGHALRLERVLLGLERAARVLVQRRDELQPRRARIVPDRGAFLHGRDRGGLRLGASHERQGGVVHVRGDAREVGELERELELVRGLAFARGRLGEPAFEEHRDERAPPVWLARPRSRCYSVPYNNELTASVS